LFSPIATNRFRPAINCRIRLRLYYKSLIPSPARGKAKIPIFRVNGAATGTIDFQALGDY
jgi:hypothetical protein